MAIDSDKPVYTQSLDIKVWVSSCYLVEILGSFLNSSVFIIIIFKLPALWNVKVL